MVNKPTHIFESLTDHLHIKKALMEKFFSNVTTENIFFSDHDAVTILLILKLMHKIRFNVYKYGVYK